MARSPTKSRIAAKKGGARTAAKRRNAGSTAKGGAGATGMQQPSAGFLKWEGRGNRYGYFDMPRTSGKRGGGQGGGPQATL